MPTNHARRCNFSLAPCESAQCAHGDRKDDGTITVDIPIYIYDVPTESGADMLLEKNVVFAEATLKKVDLWWKWHFGYHLKSEEESTTFGLKAKWDGLKLMLHVGA